MHHGQKILLGQLLLSFSRSVLVGLKKFCQNEKNKKLTLKKTPTSTKPPVFWNFAKRRSSSENVLYKNQIVNMGSLTYPSRSKNTTGTTGFRYNLPPLGHSNKHKKFEKWLKKQNSSDFTLISKQKKMNCGQQKVHQEKNFMEKIRLWK